MNPGFIHLRIHSEYSLSDGLVQIQALVDKAASDHMPALAITDQSNLLLRLNFIKKH
jgi:DNA polymerase-3 subunit alpha